MPTEIIKTVLMVTPFASPNMGGAETHIDKLSGYLWRKKWHVVTATYQPLTSPRPACTRFHESGERFDTYRMPWFGRKWALFNTLERWPFPFPFAYLFPGLLLVSLYAAWCHRKSITCVHAHGLVASAVALILKYIFGFRIVASTHAIYGLASRSALASSLGWLFRRFDFVLAVGDPSRNELIERSHVNPEIKVHPNWVDTELFRPAPPNEPHSPMSRMVIGRMGADRYSVLFVGRLIEKKGIYVLLGAASKLPGVHFDVLGGGELKAGTIIPVNVSFRGARDNTFLSVWYQRAWVTIIPSQYEEGFSATMCESLACGTPVMIPRRGVPATVLTEQVAIFIDPTAEGIVDGIRRLRERPIDRDTCRQFALAHFSERNAEIIERSYHGTSR